MSCTCFRVFGSLSDLCELNHQCFCSYKQVVFKNILQKVRHLLYLQNCSSLLLKSWDGGPESYNLIKISCSIYATAMIAYIEQLILIRLGELQFLTCKKPSIYGEDFLLHGLI